MANWSGEFRGRVWKKIEMMDAAAAAAGYKNTESVIRL